MSNKKIAPPTAEIIHVLETSDVSKREVAKQFGISEQRVSSILKRAGVVTFRERRRQVQTEAILDALRTTEDSVPAIATRLGVPETAVFNAHRGGGRSFGGNSEPIRQTCPRCHDAKLPRHFEQGSKVCRECSTERAGSCLKVGQAAIFKRVGVISGMIEFFVSTDIEDAVAAMGFLMTHNRLEIHREASLVFFAESPDEMAVQFLALKMALGYRHRLPSPEPAWFHVPGPVYREMNGFDAPTDSGRFGDARRMIAQAPGPVEVCLCGLTRHQTAIAETVARLLAGYEPRPMRPPTFEPDSPVESVARLLRQTYSRDFLEKLAERLIF